MNIMEATRLALSGQLEVDSNSVLTESIERPKKLINNNLKKENVEIKADNTEIKIDDDKRHDLNERKKFINAADVVFLCLPDDGAREAITLIENPEVCIIDASTAHRTSEGWTYGYPELSKAQRKAIKNSKINCW